MKLKTDENLPTEAVNLLRAAEHDVETAVSEGLAGRDDEAVLSTAAAEGRILITADRMLADVRVLGGKPHPGVVVLRLPKRGEAAISRAISTLLGRLTEEALAGRIWIVGPTRIRVRE